MARGRGRGTDQPLGPLRRAPGKLVLSFLSWRRSPRLDEAEPCA